MVEALQHGGSIATEKGHAFLQCTDTSTDFYVPRLKSDVFVHQWILGDLDGTFLANKMLPILQTNN